MVARLKVSGTQLVDASTGGAVKLRGVSTHGLQWFPQFVNKDTFQKLRDEWSVNVVRLALYVEEGGYTQDGYVQGKSYQTLRQGIDAAIALDMYCIVDWHVSNADQTPMKHLQEAQAFFQGIAAEYPNDPHILYELCNEPNGVGNDYASQIAPYVDQVIPYIRRISPDSVLIIGSGMWSQQPDVAFAHEGSGRSNVMYTLHRYCDNGFDQWAPALQALVAKGCPVFATECGVSNPEETDWNCADEFRKIIALYEELGIPWCVWSACDKGEPSSIFTNGTNTSNAGEIVKEELLKYAAPKPLPPTNGSTSSSTTAKGSTSHSSPATQNSSSSASQKSSTDNSSQYPSSSNNPTPPAPVNHVTKGSHMGIGVQLDPNGVSFTLSVLDANNQPLASTSFATPADLKAFADYLESQASIAAQATAPKASLLSLASDIAPGDQPPTPRTDALEKNVKALADSHNKVLGTLGLLDGVLGGGGLFPHPPWGGGYPGGYPGGYYPQQPVYVPQQPVYVPQPAQPVYQPAPQPVVVQQPVFQPIPVQAPVVVGPVWRGGPVWGR